MFQYNWCFGLKTWSSLNSYIETLTPNVMVCGDGSFGRKLSHENGSLMIESVPYQDSKRFFSPSLWPCTEESHVWSQRGNRRPLKLRAQGFTELDVRASSSDLQHRNYEKIYACCLSHPVYCILLQQLEQNKTTGSFKSCVFYFVHWKTSQTGPTGFTVLPGAPGHTESRNPSYGALESSQEHGLSCRFGKGGHWWCEQRCHLSWLVFVNRIRVTPELEYIWGKSKKTG